MDSDAPPVGEFGADGGWLCVSAGVNWYAVQLPNPAMMRHIARGQGHVDGGARLRRREDDRRERARRLDGSKAAAAAG